MLRAAASGRRPPGLGPGRLRFEILALVAVAATSTGLSWAMEHRPYDMWAALPVGVGLVAVSYPMLRRVAAHEVDARIARLLWWAFALKLLGAIPRYIVDFGLYDGTADASGYSQIGAGLARQFRAGDFSVDVALQLPGTGFIELLTGVVYTLVGATTLGASLVFSWFGFWGLYLLHRAFVRAVPDGDHWLYARLVFLLPSMLFWPSSIGKEAWMCLGIGIVAYAASRLLTGVRGGLLLLAIGSLMLGMVRPHVAAILGFAVLAAFLVRRPPTGASIFAPLGKLAVLVVLSLGMVFAVGQLEDFFGVDDFNADAVQSTLDDVQRRTGQGGSQFIDDSGTDLNPSRFPEAFVNVMFRPFPWQATNAQALFSSGEAIFVFAMLVRSGRRILGGLASLLRRPYLVLCGVYTVLFVYGFSSFSNAGILVRQRVQVLPFVLVAVCLPIVERRSSRDDAPGDDAPGGDVESDPSTIGRTADLRRRAASA